MPPNRSLLAALFLAGLALLAGCASRPAEPAGGSERDGPELQVPPDLHLTPNAEPKLEPIRKGGPNKPYEVLGQRYEPLTEDRPLAERGLASWYGKKFHGRPTSSGEVYNMYAMTAAHATMPIPSYARVRNPANGREVIVRINDRGPFHSGRIIDLSYTAALKLDVLRGVSTVEVERITYEEIRSGAWQRNGDPPVYAAAPAVGAPPPLTTAQIAATPVPDTPPPPYAAAGFWVQLGAFSRLDGAEQMRARLVRELDWLAPMMAIFKDSRMHRLQAGPYRSREEARQAATRVQQAVGMNAVVVERK
ncbi:septal ring lytic transglycosylase RlpA family protein [Roseateles violae]|uniref:Endolytic peptidoglycan transglycosylase RlpA n=1 Tax=Roseateles violae TaxID=3058042 RepID=A0ABT8DN31_9BURK|nr:septal ring lytic transglycosylase RlpA family protein [Pelomonas sp. PFR6]MDN3919353.1 septal ring lytic transglycosylase RlpA family protein [Pelomonas sp. PFR6]